MSDFKTEFQRKQTEKVLNKRTNDVWVLRRTNNGYVINNRVFYTISEAIDLWFSDFMGDFNDTHKHNKWKWWFINVHVMDWDFTWNFSATKIHWIYHCCRFFVTLTKFHFLEKESLFTFVVNICYDTHFKKCFDRQLLKNRLSQLFMFMAWSWLTITKM